MPITIVDSELDRRIDALIQAQPVKASRASMATAILERACDQFERTGDADAWRVPAAGSTSARENGTGRSDESMSNQPSPSHPAIQKPGKTGDTTTPKQRANAA